MIWAAFFQSPNEVQSGVKPCQLGIGILRIMQFQNVNRDIFSLLHVLKYNT